MKQIISFSRRTDGPAFYMDILKNAIEQGWIDVLNPFNRKPYHISLAPSDVAGFVFWSKNFKPLLGKLDILNRYASPQPILSRTLVPVYFQFTRNSEFKELEPFSPALDMSFEQIRELVEISSPRHVMWRFDPIIFWKDAENIIENTRDFKEIADHFADAGIRNCTISFVTYYSKVERRLKQHNIDFYKPSFREIKKIIKKLTEIANSFNIKIYSCCNPDLLNLEGISQAHCIDGEYLQKLWRTKLSIAKDSGQREGCGCTKSRDIGGYGKEWECKFGCIYCYANPRRVESR
jgi:hypothetical protein